MSTHSQHSLLLSLILATSCSTTSEAPSRYPDGSTPSIDSSTDAPPTSSDATSADASSVGERCRGYTTRYWDCCKAHCGWAANNDDGVSPVTSCNAANMPLASMPDAPSACDTGIGPAGAHTCYSMSPWAVSDSLAYGFAAVPAREAICGRCFQLEFDGTGHYDPSDPGSQTLVGKTMIVQATNIGYDVDGGQFDILIPGGGVGIFDACSSQWGITDSSQLGAQYGGILTSCRERFSDYGGYRSCVRESCDSLFGSTELSVLRAGCEWFVDWYGAADNPNVNYIEVPCPEAIVERSGVDRRPLEDLRPCSEG